MMRGVSCKLHLSGLRRSEVTFLGQGMRWHATASVLRTAALHDASGCAQEPGLWSPRRVGHPAAFDASPRFSELPHLQDARMQAALGLSLSAGRPLRARRLNSATAATVFPSETDAYHRLARSLAARTAMDAKELVEAVEFFGKVRRRIRRHTVVDLAAGHGLAGLLFAAFEPTVHRVLLLDQRRPLSFTNVLAAVCEVAPWVSDKVSYLTADITTVLTTSDPPPNEPADTRAARDYLRMLPPGTAGFVAVHACGSLTDTCLSIATRAHGPVAVLPCCFTGTARDAPAGLRRVLGVSMAADVHRAYCLESDGYSVDFSAIPACVTPLNRVLVAVRRREESHAVSPER